MSNREAALAALYSLGQSIGWTDPESGQPVALAYSSRRVIGFSDVPAQPAFLQAEGDETIYQESSKPYKMTLGAHWIFYHKAGANAGATPAQTNNAIVEAALTALTPVDNPFTPGRFSLGGLAYHVWVNGKVFKDPGDIDQQGVVVIPISILLPA